MKQLETQIQNYLNFCANESSFTERSLKRYQYILMVYNDYLISKVMPNSETLTPYLNAVTPEQIFASVEYYINSDRKVTSEETVLLYISVIKEFFRYLMKESIIQNPHIISFGLSDEDSESFSYKYATFIKPLIDSKRIKHSSDGSPLSENHVSQVIQYCNKCLSLRKYNRLPSKRASYNAFVKALIAKIIALTGVSMTEKITSLTLEDLNLNYGYLLIDGYNVFLPFYLRLQFNDYLTIYRGGDNPKNTLFIKYDGDSIAEPNFVGGFIGNAFYKFEDKPMNFKPRSTICLAKYAIIRLIDIGIDRDAIRTFTGYGDTVYDSCKNLADVGLEIENKKIISNTLKTLPIFDQL